MPHRSHSESFSLVRLRVPMKLLSRFLIPSIHLTLLESVSHQVPSLEASSQLFYGLAISTNLLVCQPNSSFDRVSLRIATTRHPIHRSLGKLTVCSLNSRASSFVRLNWPPRSASDLNRSLRFLEGASTCISLNVVLMAPCI